MDYYVTWLGRLIVTSLAHYQNMFVHQLIH